MIVSRKNYSTWQNLRGKLSRLSGPCLNKAYTFNSYHHKLYGRSYGMLWDLNGKSFWIFKEDIF